MGEAGPRGSKGKAGADGTCHTTLGLNRTLEASPKRARILASPRCSLIGWSGSSRFRSTAAQGGTQGVGEVVDDVGKGDRHAAAGGADAAACGRRRVEVDEAVVDTQRALVGDAAAGDGGVAADGAAGQRSRTGV